MDSSGEDGETIAVSAFKPRSLELIERVASGKAARLVLTKRGRPVAVLLPVGERPLELWGALRGLMELVAEVDLTAPTGEVWAAEQGSYDVAPPIWCLFVQDRQYLRRKSCRKSANHV